MASSTGMTFNITAISLKPSNKYGPIFPPGADLREVDQNCRTRWAGRFQIRNQS
jgi:hypothetical protein